MRMEQFLQRLERAIWGWPLLLLLLGAGLYLLIRLRFLPLRMLPAALRLTLRPSREEPSGVTAFGALCTSLSATIGTGNMVGVATALSLGGPGALFWMEISALTGLALKYAEGLLAVAFRRRNADGGWSGGPFAYIALGLGGRYRALAKAFSVFGAMAGLCGVGTFVQMGSVSACLTALLSESGHRLWLVRLPWGAVTPVAGIAAGLVFSVLALRFLFGGIETISRFSARIVPLMCGLYLLCCVWILVRFADRLPAVIGSVLVAAWNPRAFGGGFLGCVTAGVSRGVFSNEAGLGTAPIAAASAEGVSLAEQGLISMTATVFDTFLICTLTGLVVLVTDSAGAGVGAAMLAFARGLPLPEPAAKGLVLLLLSSFAFTTVVGWSFYGTACLDDLTGDSVRCRKLYLALYGLSIALAPLCSVRGIWSAANVCNALMALPNVTAILLLSNRIAEMSRNILDFQKPIRYNKASIRKERSDQNARENQRDRSRRRGDRVLRPERGGHGPGKIKLPRPGDRI